MEELGDWIYWIIIIVAGISSLISSINKKSKQEAERRQSREVTTEEWEDVFSDSGDVETPQPAVPERRPVFPERQPVVPERRPVVPELQPVSSGRQPAAAHVPHAQPERYFNYKTPGKKSANSPLFGNDTENTFLYTNDDNATITLDDLPANTDEWRKAFIYNEVFKRQY